MMNTNNTNPSTPSTGQAQQPNQIPPSVQPTSDSPYPSVNLNLTTPFDNNNANAASAASSAPRASPTTFLTLEQVNSLLREMTAVVTANLNRHPQPPSLLTPADDPYSNTKIESMASVGTTLKFNGDQSTFAPWFSDVKSLLNISVWKDSTLLNYNNKTYDLLYDFMEIPENTIKIVATKRWTDPNLLANHNKKKTAEFHIKLLHLFLINSVTTTFRTTIKNRAGSLLSNDGQYFLWLICHHVHHNKNSFVKSIKDLIRTHTIAKDHNNDVEAYINWCIHQLQALQLEENDTTHNDLLDPIFAQLKATTIERLTTSVDDWYEDHYSNTSEVTPLQLLHKADRKIQTLRSANMLNLTKPNDEPSIMALQAAIHDQSQKFSDAFNQLTANLAQRPPISYHNRSTGPTKPNPRPNPPTTHPWKTIPPTNLDEVRLFEGREWRWCPKCNHHRGLWVTSHKPWLHQDRSNTTFEIPKRTANDAPPTLPYSILSPSETRKRPTDVNYSRQYSSHKQARTNTPYRAQVAVHDILPNSDEPYDPFGVYDDNDDNVYPSQDTYDDNGAAIYPEEEEQQN